MKSISVHNTKKHQILTVAADLFLKNGYIETPLSVIAEAVDLNKSTLFHHFLNKENIAESILENIYNFYEEEIFDKFIESRDKAKNSHEYFLDLLEKSFGVRPNFIFLLYKLKSVHNDSINTLVENNICRWVEILQIVLKDTCNNDPYQIKKLAYFSVSMIFGYCFLNEICKEDDFNIKDLCNNLRLAWSGHQLKLVSQ